MPHTQEQLKINYKRYVSKISCLILLSAALGSKFRHLKIAVTNIATYAGVKTGSQKFIANSIATFGILTDFYVLLFSHKIKLAWNFKMVS